MNALTTHPTAAPDSLEALAHRILAGDMSGLPKVDHQHHTDEEWQREAQAVVDSGETDDLAGMIALEVAHSDWIAAGSPDDRDPAYTFSMKRFGRPASAGTARWAA